MRGTGLDFLADLSAIVHAIKRTMTDSGMPKEEAERLIDHSVKAGKTSESELVKDTAETLAKLIGILTQDCEEASEAGEED